VTVGLLHPGEMGAAIGAALVAAGQEVLWVPDGRSPATSARASAAGLADAGSLDRLVGASDVILSVCPPHAALDVATAVAAAGTGPGKTGWHYIDANAVSPVTSLRISEIVEGSGARFIDGGIIGRPPLQPGTTRLYLSGPDAIEVTPALATPVLELHVISEAAGDASALKLSYAAWTKASAALVLVAREAAARSGVESALLAEWRTSQPGLIERSDAARIAAVEKGWRWTGEMEEIASMLGALGLPPGFHLAAAEVFHDNAGQLAH
jgi:3-hydroxyisobutyrate dehydrogenase-like beta-hydroxyacid dehydrogenase